MGLAGGKLVVMYGGQNQDGTGMGGQQREVNPLHLDSLAWQPPLGVKTSDFINAHSAVTVARTKMMSYRSASLAPNGTCMLHLFYWGLCIHHATKSCSYAVRRRHTRAVVVSTDLVYSPDIVFA